MKEGLTEIIDTFWAGRLPALMQRVEARKQQIENILVLEDFYRKGHGQERLQRAMGDFGSQVLDMSSLSSTLRQGDQSRTMHKERYHRMQSIHQELEKVRDGLRAQPPQCGIVKLEQDVQAILDAFEQHINPVAKAFRTLRIAQLEAGAAYEAAQHDLFFENFNWRQLDKEEMGLCPPFVVFSEPSQDFGGYLSQLLHLLTSGKPLKVVVLRDRLDNEVTETGRAAALKSATDVELLFIALRNVYCAQGSPAGDTPLEGLVAKSLDSPRPGLLSIFSGNHSQGPGHSRAAVAHMSRGFPHFVYDPDKANDFVSCLDLSDNPELEALWPMAELEYVDEEGAPQKLERPLTFADFAAGEEALQSQFSPLSQELEDAGAIPLAEYFALTAGQRRGKTPFICTVDADKHLVKLVPSQSVIAQSSDKMHLWHTLQELGGIGNPFVQAAEQSAVERLSAENQEALDKQKAEFEANINAREHDAVAAAMKNLALQLTGAAPPPTAVPPAPVTASAQPPASGETGAVGQEAGQEARQAAASVEPAAPTPAAGEAPAAVSETPWIEEDLCTTCDECTAINKKIFVYNAAKKAIIKDARGGPYRDIVKAAEKCASGAIHPGLPLDPEEKDVDKWIKRAEPFQ